MSLSHNLKLISPSGNQLFGTGLIGPVNHTSAAVELLDKLWVHRMRRNGNAAAATMWHSAGPHVPFHHLVDPTTTASAFTLIYENMIQAAVAAGACRVFAGFWQYITGGVANTLMGVGFYADAADNLWHCAAFDCPTSVAPVTSRFDFASAVLMTSLHRLRLEIDGPTKKISWYIDNVLITSWTPAAALDKMSNGAGAFPEIVHGATVPALGDVSVRGYPGSLPLMRFLVRTTT